MSSNQPTQDDIESAISLAVLAFVSWVVYGIAREKDLINPLSTLREMI